MVYIKTKEGASLLVALLAAVIVAVTTTLLDVVWWMTLCAAAGVFVVMALVALFIIRKYVAYKLKPIYSIVLSRDVHTNEIFSELKDKHVENIGEELTAWADTNDKEIATSRKAAANMMAMYSSMARFFFVVSGCSVVFSAASCGCFSSGIQAFPPFFRERGGRHTGAAGPPAHKIPVQSVPCAFH